MLRVVLFVALMSWTLSAQAVDNSKRVVGLGVNTQFAGGSAGVARPAQLSAKFALQPRLEVSALFGLRAASTLVVTPGAKFAWVLVPEKHMNLYATGSMSVDVRGRGGLTALVWQLGPGVEVFLSEWPNLGFSLEFGIGGEVLAGAGAGPQGPFGTTTSGFGGAGIHYYF